MKTVFVSNYYNHHQSALCRALCKNMDCFHFVSTGEMRQERRNLGYGMDAIPEYVLYSYKEEVQKRLCETYIQESDVVIAGATPEKMVSSRIRKGGLTFRYTERLLKRGLDLKRYSLQWLLLHWRNPGKKPVYLLCAGSYVALDYHKFGLFQNKAYKWGYFPEVKEYEDVNVLLSAKQKNLILWAGRLIDWKHPDYAIQVAQRLKKAGFCFELNVIGSGELETQLKTQIKELQLTDCVHLLGSMKPEQVRAHMEVSGIFMATSDKREGWGAVVNEAMNSGCAVIASHAMGAVPYLIENEKNGLIFQSENIDMLYEKMKDLLEHPEKQAALGRQAYETITTMWNAEVASQRLIALSERILAGEEYPDLYESGPCSRADVQPDHWNN